MKQASITLRLLFPFYIYVQKVHNLYVINVKTKCIVEKCKFLNIDKGGKNFGTSIEGKAKYLFGKERICKYGQTRIKIS